MLTEDMVNREFTRVFKGYDIGEVEDYIEALIELYNQLANENRELVLRCDTLAKSLTETQGEMSRIQSVSSDRDEILRRAEEEAREIVRSAREKAQSTIDAAESTSRELLREVKARAEEADRIIEQRQKDSEEKAQETLDAAMTEAKQLIRATKTNCIKRAEECESDLSAARERYDQMLVAARDFRERLFTLYSEQILSIESFEIDTPSTETLAVDDAEGQADDINTAIDAEPSQTECDDPSDAAQVEEIPDYEIEEAASETADEETGEPSETSEAAQTADVEEAENIESPEPTPEPTPDLLSEEEQPYITETEAVAADVEESDAEKAETILLKRDRTIVERAVFDDSVERKVTPFSIEKERSGQVHYDSRDISSVNRKLEDIIAKKGGADTLSENNVSRKLGFLK